MAYQQVYSMQEMAALNNDQSANFERDDSPNYLGTAAGVGALGTGAAVGAGELGSRARAAGKVGNNRTINAALDRFEQAKSGVGSAIGNARNSSVGQAVERGGRGIARKAATGLGLAGAGAGGYVASQNPYETRRVAAEGVQGAEEAANRATGFVSEKASQAGNAAGDKLEQARKGIETITENAKAGEFFDQLKNLAP